MTDNNRCDSYCTIVEELTEERDELRRSLATLKPRLLDAEAELEALQRLEELYRPQAVVARAQGRFVVADRMDAALARLDEVRKEKP